MMGSNKTVQHDLVNYSAISVNTCFNFQLLHRVVLSSGAKKLQPIGLLAYFLSYTLILMLP